MNALRDQLKKHAGARRVGATAMLAAVMATTAGAVQADINREMVDLFNRVCLETTPQFAGAVDILRSLGFSVEGANWGHYEFWIPGGSNLSGALITGEFGAEGDHWCDVTARKVNMHAVRELVAQALAERYDITPSEHEFEWPYSSGWKVIISNRVFNIQIQDVDENEPELGGSVTITLPEWG